MTEHDAYHTPDGELDESLLGEALLVDAPNSDRYKVIIAEGETVDVANEDEEPYDENTRAVPKISPADL